MITLKYSKIIDLFKKRIIEIVGLLIVTLSVFLLLSLSTYNLEDPNFIFSGNTEIHNLFGFYGSFVSDLFLQSVGIVSFLFCLTIFTTGILVVKSKKLECILKNLFYSLIYIFLGATAISIYENDSFWLILNGNGGFVGQYSKDFIFSFGRLIDQNIVFYFLAAFAMLFFLLSVRFDIGVVFNIIRFIYYKITKKR